MQEQVQYGWEVRRYGKCWATGNEQRDRRMLEVAVMPVARRPFLDVQQVFRGTPRCKPTHKAKRKARTGCESTNNAALTILAPTSRQCRGAWRTTWRIARQRWRRCNRSRKGTRRMRLASPTGLGAAP